MTTEDGGGSTRRPSLLFVNTTSRRGAEAFEESRQKLIADGVNLVRATAYTDVDRLLWDAKQAVKEKAPMLIVGGGDGTISAVAGLVANTQSSLGILPLGTGNEFARDLQIPMDVAGACDVICNGRIVHVDLGKIEDRIFVNVATLGLTTKIAEQLTNPMKARFGRFAYVFALIGGLRNLRPFQAVLSTENGVTEFECMQLVIGNGRLHAGPFPVSPRAGLRIGKFTIYALMGNSRGELLKYALMLPGGHHVMLAQVHCEQAAHGTLKTVPRVKTTVDGEIFCRTPVKFQTMSSALKVLAPADFDG